MINPTGGSILKEHAVTELYGRNSYIECDDNGVVDWKDGHETTSTETTNINSKYDELVAAYSTLRYARNRKHEYDALNQFELISDDDANSTTTHVDAIVAIKTKWPKNNTGPVE